jgi:hypothetical protein
MDSPLHYLQLQHKTKEIYERDSKEQNGKAKELGGWGRGDGNGQLIYHQTSDSSLRFL